MSLRYLVAGLLALICVLGCRPATRPPNVVIYLVDTLRADHLGVYGYQRETSPRLDAFARKARRSRSKPSSKSGCATSATSADRVHRGDVPRRPLALAGVFPVNRQERPLSC